MALYACNVFAPTSDSDNTDIVDALEEVFPLIEHFKQKNPLKVYTYSNKCNCTNLLFSSTMVLSDWSKEIYYGIVISCLHNDASFHDGNLPFHFICQVMQFNLC